MSSRLFQEVREKRGLCYSIFAQPGAYSDGGALTIYSGTSSAQVGALASVVVEELRRIPDTLSTAEVDRARAQMKAGLLMGLESPAQRAERAARMVAIWDRVPGLDEVIARIDAVTVDSVRSFATRLCETADPALALYGPVSDAPLQAEIKERLAA